MQGGTFTETFTFTAFTVQYNVMLIDYKALLGYTLYVCVDFEPAERTGRFWGFKLNSLCKPKGRQLWNKPGINSVRNNQQTKHTNVYYFLRIKVLKKRKNNSVRLEISNNQRIFSIQSAAFSIWRVISPIVHTEVCLQVMFTWENYCNVEKKKIV